MTFDELFAEHNLTPDERKSLVVHLASMRAQNTVESLTAPPQAQPVPEPAPIPRGLLDALRNYRQCDEDGAECIASREAVETAARLLSGFEAYPECSGNPVSCPENEGYGCCHLTDEQIRQLCRAKS